jgi:hypothetical protein
MPRPTDRELFLRELRAVKGRATNGQLQAALGWSKEKYWTIHRALYDYGEIERGRGYGGIVVLAGFDPENPDPREEALRENLNKLKPTTKVLNDTSIAAALTAARELELYKPVSRELERNWAQYRNLDNCHCEITALQGRRETGGSWSRPDLALIGYRKYEFLPEKVFELYTFEVKAANDVSIKGVMEALAHREAATRSYVIYHTAGKDFEDLPEAKRIEELAAKHGIGVFAAKDVEDFNQWAEIVSARRSNPDPEAVDTFIKRTLSETAKTQIRKWF